MTDFDRSFVGRGNVPTIFFVSVKNYGKSLI